MTATVDSKREYPDVVWQHSAHLLQSPVYIGKIVSDCLLVNLRSELEFEGANGSVGLPQRRNWNSDAEGIASKMGLADFRQVCYYEVSCTRNSISCWTPEKVIENTNKTLEDAICMMSNNNGQNKNLLANAKPCFSGNLLINSIDRITIFWS